MILLVAVYVPPTANNSNGSEALNELSEQQTANPDKFLITAGDFNHTHLKVLLPPPVGSLITSPSCRNPNTDSESHQANTKGGMVSVWPGGDPILLRTVLTLLTGTFQDATHKDHTDIEEYTENVTAHKMH